MGKGIQTHSISSLIENLICKESNNDTWQISTDECKKIFNFNKTDNKSILDFIETVPLSCCSSPSFIENIADGNFFLEINNDSDMEKIIVKEKYSRIVYAGYNSKLTLNAIMEWLILKLKRQIICDFFEKNIGLKLYGDYKFLHGIEASIDNIVQTTSIVPSVCIIHPCNYSKSYYSDISSTLASLKKLDISIIVSLDMPRDKCIVLDPSFVKLYYNQNSMVIGRNKSGLYEDELSLQVYIDCKNIRPSTICSYRLI